MAVTHCKQTTKYPQDSRLDFVKKFPLYWFEPGSEIRMGFEKGTLVKATFEMTYGATIVYERWEE